MRLMPAGLALLFMLAACHDGAAQQAAEQARLLEADRALAADSLDHGTAAAYYARMSEDAMQLPANAPPVQGNRKVRDRLESLGAQVLDWTPRQAEVSRSLDLGWTWGEWRLLESAESKKLLARGKYLKVWKRGADGAWTLAADIGNQADEVPPPPSASP